MVNLLALGQSYEDSSLQHFHSNRIAMCFLDIIDTKLILWPGAIMQLELMLTKIIGSSASYELTPPRASNLNRY